MPVFSAGKQGLPAGVSEHSVCESGFQRDRKKEDKKEMQKGDMQKFARIMQ